jgi:2-dehydropantoate 2-reductase
LDDIKTGFHVNLLDDGTWESMPHGKDGEDIAYSDHDERLRSGDLPEDLARSKQDDETIECLIVTVKAQQTVAALKSVRHRLTPESTVLLLQNGMGTVEEITEKVFPDPQQRPQYMMGIISHGLLRNESFHVSHTGIGTTILSPVSPRGSLGLNEKEADWAPSTKYLLRTLTLTPSLVAVAETPTNLLQYQLEKLAMNCVINSFTVLLDCQNGELLYNYTLSRAMRLLLIEISTVICSLPELQGVPGIKSRFAPERLRKMAVNLANRTAKNTSSMLQDVQRGQKTEIEYINGYIVRRGDELGVRCALNYLLMQLIHGKTDILSRRAASAIPMDLSGLEDI